MFAAFCKAQGLPEPTPEYYFCLGRHWRFDWAWPAHHLALEVEGGLWKGKPCPLCKQRTGGRHNRGTGFLRDMDKYNSAAIQNWRVLRCTPKDMKSGAVFDLLRRAFNG